VIAIAAFILAVNMLLPGVRGVLQGVEDFRRYSLAIVIEGLGKVALSVGLVYRGYGVLGAVGGYALASGIGLLYAVVAVRTNWWAPTAPLRLDLRRLIQTTGGIALSTLSITTLGFADVVLVKHFFDTHTAGIYGAISLAGKVLLFAAGFIPTIVLPKATRRASLGASPLPILLQAACASIAISAACLVLFVTVPHVIVRAMTGVAFAAAAPYVFPYGVAMTLLGTTALVATYKIGLHRFDFVVPLAVVTLAEIVAMNILHSSLMQIIRILLVGHALALACTVYRIGAGPIGPAVRTT
jgi:O-antigen/teichoic acid export membrane protein